MFSLVETVDGKIEDQEGMLRGSVAEENPLFETDSVLKAMHARHVTAKSGYRLNRISFTFEVDVRGIERHVVGRKSGQPSRVRRLKPFGYEDSVTTIPSKE